MANTDLVFRLFGIDVSAGTALDRVRFRAVETGGALETMGKYGAIAFAAVGVAAVTAAVKGIEMASNFQRQMLLLNTQAGVSKDKLAGLSAGVLDLAGQVGFSPQSLAEALYFVESNFASLGKKAPDAMGVLKYAAEGAKIGMANLTDTTTSLTATLAAFSKNGMNAHDAMATLNAIVGQGEMTWQQLNEAIKTGVMATMQQYGVRLNEVGAALATFGDNNLRGAAAGTALRMAVQALAKPIRTAETTLQSIGLSMTSLRDAMAKKGLTGALDLFSQAAVNSGYKLADFKKQSSDVAAAMRAHGITAAMQEFAKKAIESGTTTKNLGSLIMDVFGKRAGTGIAILLGEMDRYKSKIPQISAAAKKFDGAWEDTSQSVQVQWDKLRGKWDAFLIHLGDVLIPWVNGTVLPALSNIVDWFDTNLPTMEGDWLTFTKHVSDGFHTVMGAWDDVKRTLSDNVWAGSLAVLFGVIGAEILLWRGYVMGVAAAEAIAALAAWGWAGAMGALDALMDANIFLVLAGVILAVGAALYYAYTHSVTFRNIVNDLGGVISNAAKLWWTAFNTAVDIITGALQMMGSALIAGKDKAIGFGQGVRSVMLSVGSGFVTAGSVVGRVLATMMHAAISFGETIRSVGSAVLGAIRTFIIGGFVAAGRAALSMAGIIIHAAASALGWVPGVGPKLQAAAAAFDRFAAEANAALSSIQDQSATFTLNFEVRGNPPPGTAANVSRLYANKPLPTGYASGGDFGSGRVMRVGENGPELVSFDAPGHVWPTGTGPTDGGSSGAVGGGDVHIHIQQAVVGGEREIVRVIDAAYKRVHALGYIAARA